jgi:uncharacterized membrane protein YeaQ/YmgE (transglycosylase-associated protein family)
MPLETLILWVVGGLVAGWLASAVVGGGYGVGGYGVGGDIVLGMLGAVLGGWLCRAFHIATPFSGMLGAIFVAFIGALVLLLLLRVARRSRV